MGKKQHSKFPAAKIKKIIQENSEIGKLCNTIPPIIERSLQLFLDDIVAKLVEIVPEYDLTKLTLPALKRSLELSSYDFMKDALDHVEDLDQGRTKKPKKREQPVLEIQETQIKPIKRVKHGARSQ